MAVLGFLHTKARVTGSTTTEDERQHREQWSPPRRLSRSVKLVLLTLIGICLLSGLTHPDKAQQHSAVASPTQTISSPSPEPGRPVGTQAGGVEQHTQTLTPQAPALPTACGLLDINCDLNSAAQWLAQGIQSAIQPVTDAIDHDPSNFISQTPICVSGCPTNDSPYQSNGTISIFVNWAIGIVNVAVASLLLWEASTS